MNEEIINISLEKAVNLFIYEKRTICKPETVQVYSNRLKYFVDYLTMQRGVLAMDIPMVSITLNDLKNYNLYLADKVAFSSHPFAVSKKKAISDTTRHAYTHDLKIFFRWAYAENYINFDIAQKFKIVKKDQQMILPLYQDEVDQIDGCFNLKSETGLRNWCLIHVMLDCGLRRGEVIELKLQDVNFEKEYLHIVLSKDSKSRYIWLPPKVKNNMYKYYQLYHSGMKKDDSFFQTIKTGEPLTECSIANLFTRLKNRSGVEKVHPHLLRHTFASAFILGGGDIRTLQGIMGHSTISVTEKYVHISKNYKYLADDVYKLDKNFIRRYY